MSARLIIPSDNDLEICQARKKKLNVWSGLVFYGGDRNQLSVGDGCLFSGAWRCIVLTIFPFFWGGGGLIQEIAVDGEFKICLEELNEKYN